jgi:uncharacterized protein (TIGR02266 family)
MQHSQLATPAIDNTDDPRATSDTVAAPALRGGAASARRASPRTTLRVRCSCASEQEFVQRYAADISPRGMFLRTAQQLPLGARVRFELLLQSGRCALGGVGRVSWLRAAEPALGRGAGAGVAFERLRRGDRAVIERMDLARGSAPSRFDQPPDGDSAVRVGRTAQPPSGVELAKLLFEDLGVRSESDAGTSAFLSADLSTELGDGGWRFGVRGANGELVADLAEELEPGAEPRGDELEVEVQGDQAEPGDERAQTEAALHSTVRPAPLPHAAQHPTPAPADGTAPAQRSGAALRARIQALRAPGSQPPAARVARSVARSPRSARERAVGRPAAAPVDRNVSAAALERTASVPAALARAAVELANAAPVAAPPAAPAQPPAAPPVAITPPASAMPAAAAAPAAPAPAAAALPVATAAAATRKRRRSTWPLALALSAIIIVASAVTYLALTDQLPRVLAMLGLAS